MSIAQSLLPEVDYEFANLRKTLARLPADQMDFKPHEKSWPAGTLATHLAQLALWGALTINTTELDLATPFPSNKPATPEEILAILDEQLAIFRNDLAKADDETLMTPWTLKKGDHVIFTMPRVAVIRTSVINHMIHHRGQFTVYLRLMNIPVPALYGPSADEGSM